MWPRRRFLASLAAVAGWVQAGCRTAESGARSRASGATRGSSTPRRFEVERTDEDWRALLTPEQYRVTRLKGTERAFSGEYWSTKAKGIYRCVGCGQDLFGSESKFESGTGWPSFWAPIDPSHVLEEPDGRLVVVRTEVLCGRCGAHLGHVFEDGPRPTGLRYCINSAALKLVPAK